MRYWIFVLVCLVGLRVGAETPATNSERVFPVNGFCISAPGPAQVDRFVKFIREELAPRGVNTLVLRVDYNFQFKSHPEVGSTNGLSVADAQRIAAVCRELRIHLVPHINLLGHQSWANHTGALLRAHPEFDETPWVKNPEKYKWPNDDKLYCRSYCPLHPEVHKVVFDLIDEVCAAFGADAFHAGMDEVFYIGEEKCPRCGGKDKAELFAGEVKTIHEHLQTKGLKMWMWGDRLIDGKTTGINEWEASRNGTAGAIDLIPKDVVVCDWHYDRAEPTAAYLAMKGFPVITCTWKNSKSAAEQAEDILRGRAQANKEVKARLLGIMQTVWSGADSFMNEYDKLRADGDYKQGDKTEARCFINTTDEMETLSQVPMNPPRKRNLLFIGQSKGYQHEAINTAMATLYDLGRKSGLWNTYLRTDCTAVTKKPLKWEEKNLNAFDAIVFYTDGDLDMDDSQKADFLSFIRDDGKGFIGIHSAAITFTQWPEYGKLLGGYYDGHPWGEFAAPLVVEDGNFPGMKYFSRSFKLFDEIYVVKNFSRDKVRVLMSLDASKLDLTRKGIHRTDKDFAVMWANNYGKGRVVYSGLGHAPAVWERPDMQRMWLQVVQWVMGDVAGDATPGITK